MLFRSAFLGFVGLAGAAVFNGTTSTSGSGKNGFQFVGKFVFEEDSRCAGHEGVGLSGDTTGSIIGPVTFDADDSDIEKDLAVCQKCEETPACHCWDRTATSGTMYSSCPIANWQPKPNFRGDYNSRAPEKPANYEPAHPIVGSIQVQIETPTATESTMVGTQLWLFDDEPSSWPAVYNGGDTTMVCTEAIKHTKNCATGSCVKVDTTMFKKTAEGKTVVNFNKIDITQGTRPRYWFAVLANCDAQGGIPTDISYGAEFIQEERGWWNKQFGNNWLGLQTFFVIFFILYVPFTAIHFYGVVQLKKKLEFMHPMVQLFAVIIGLQFIMILFSVCHYGSYVNNGKGITGLLEGGEILDAVVRVLFVLLLLLLAKGWAISGNELTQKMLLIVITVIFMVLHATIVLWKYAIQDDARTSEAGGVVFMQVVLLIGWFAFAGLFAYTIYKTYTSEDNPVKAALYRNLAIVYVPWMLAVPITSVLAFALDDWERARVIEIVDVIFNTIGYMVLSFLLWPSRAEEYFCISTPDIMTGGKIDTYEQL